MNIFGIGPLEIIFVLIIGILVLGPEGMIEAGRKFGKFLRSIITSSWWQNIRKGITEIQYLPQRLMREAELDELNEIRKMTEKDFPSIGGDILKSSSWGGSPKPSPPAAQDPPEPGSQNQSQT
ncbi:MAG: twin-arginine translocase TatA/TatE family subunit [Anaerolineales bacterium]|jgi:Sec-independent protein translocase protein TatA